MSDRQKLISKLIDDSFFGTEFLSGFERSVVMLLTAIAMSVFDIAYRPARRWSKD